MKNSFFKSLTPHLIAAGVFLVLTFIYFYPVIEGKILIQSDMIQVKGSLKEASDYIDKTGEEILWSNSTFAGMPVWRGFGSNVILHFHHFITSVLPTPVFITLLSFIGFYILLQVFGLNVWLSFAGATAYSLSSFNLISLEAGHINKVLAMALMAPVLAGIILTYKGKWWAGAGVTTFFLSLQIFYNHIQISYYLLIIILLLVATELYQAVKEKMVPAFVKASLVLVGCLILSLGPNISRLWTTAVYGKSTPRAGSELLTKKQEGNGLDKDYVFAWSNGVAETFTLLIPSFYGGSSHEDLGQSSNVYKALIDNGVPKKEAKEYSKSMPLYWGDQQFTSGPVYFGAIVCFLFVLALFLIQGPLKWWVVAATVLSIVLSWGKNFDLVSDFFFSYVPMYNKFRSVTMILSIAELTVPLIGMIVLHRIITGQVSHEKTMKALKLSYYITGGLTLAFALFATALFEFESANDAGLKGQFPAWLMEALKEDRVSNFRFDALRSFVLISIAAGVLWAYLSDKLKIEYVYYTFIFFILVDLWNVDKRYLGNDDFKDKEKYEASYFVPNAANETILKDPDPNFKVFNTTTGITSDAITSYFHKSVGGYSAIKLRRYQDLIDSCFSRGDREVFNMLNTKYFIVQDKNSGEYFAQKNPEALGNGWFVSNYTLVKNADEEINKVQVINPKEEAVVDQSFQAQLTGLSGKSSASGEVKFISYHPHQLEYQTNNSNDGLAIFSEIYYQPGWNAYIDGKLTPHVRANYILRGLKIPGGNHKIVFKFEPDYYYTGETISLIFSVILVLFLLFIIWKSLKNNSKPHTISI